MLSRAEATLKSTKPGRETREQNSFDFFFEEAHHVNNVKSLQTQRGGRLGPYKGTLFIGILSAQVSSGQLPRQLPRQFPKHPGIPRREAAMASFTCCKSAVSIEFW